MKHRRTIGLVLTTSFALAPLTGCESLPGSKKEQGAVIGGVGGAVAGAAVAKNNRWIGALIGGALGAGGGYLIGAQMSKNDPSHKDEAVSASQKAEANPAKASDVQNSVTADLNHDGFVTMDEVVAMKNAGLSDQQMIDRLRATNQVFELTSTQQQFLRDRGVDQTVINSMESMNRSTPPPAAQTQTPPSGEVISQPR